MLAVAQLLVWEADLSCVLSSVIISTRPNPRLDLDLLHAFSVPQGQISRQLGRLHRRGQHLVFAHFLSVLQAFVQYSDVPDFVRVAHIISWVGNQTMPADPSSFCPFTLPRSGSLQWNLHLTVFFLFPVAPICVLQGAC